MFEFEFWRASSSHRVRWLKVSRLESSRASEARACRRGCGGGVRHGGLWRDTQRGGGGMEWNGGEHSEWHAERRRPAGSSA